MASMIIVLFHYSTEQCARPLSDFDTFSSISAFVLSKWPSIDQSSMRLFYSIGAISNCRLESDHEFTILLHIVSRCDGDLLEIMVRDGKALDVSCTAIPLCIEASATTSSSDSVCTTVEKVSKRIVIPDYYRHTKAHLKSSDWGKSIESVGQCFHGGAPEFRDVLCKYASEHGFSFVYEHNHREIVSARCSAKVTKQCGWRIYASISKSDGLMYIKRLVNEHTCGTVYKRFKNRRLTSDVISGCVVDDVRSRPSTKAKEILRDIKNSYGFDITYRVAWASLNKAKRSIYGDSAASFNGIRGYFDMLKSLDPSGQFSIDVDASDKRFIRCFVAFGAWLEGFRYCRPTLFLDGTFLTDKYKGILLIALAEDGNQGLFPVSYAVVRSEDLSNWTAFLTFLRSHLPEDRVYTFISDRHPGIITSLKNIFPDCPHAFCFFHISNNIRDRFRGPQWKKERMVTLFHKFAFATTTDMFDQYVAEFIAEGGKRAIDFLANLPKEKYVVSHFQGCRYGQTCSNPAESFNAQILPYRDLPVLQLMDGIRIKFMEQMYTRYAAACKWKTLLCPEVESTYAKYKAISRTWTVYQNGPTSFEVRSDPVMCVDYGKMTCSCGQWQEMKHPCEHGFAALFRVDLEPLTFFDPYYHASAYISTYSKNIPTVSTYGLLERDVHPDMHVYPPLLKRQPGRPRKKRIASRGEESSRKRIKCGRCGLLGFHNSRRCTSTNAV